MFGSLERFIAILLEHHEGRLPLWLAPDQVVVAPVGDSRAGYARQVADAFCRSGLRTVLDDRSESLSRRIVDARESGIPVFITVGEREERDGTVSVRRWNGEAGVLVLEDALARLRAEARLSG
ncbi:MAG TPA: His/Gly/Thr/Pro-type tRNA ligase C-terminal domain-containing protein [Arenibaculum sp.]|nr:His/Gly/Thr/Pro-type tRNA ligase C-terminal domain-containing protein [Arenibaculum sp.]